MLRVGLIRSKDPRLSPGIEAASGSPPGVGDLLPGAGHRHDTLWVTGVHLKSA